MGIIKPGLSETLFSKTQRGVIGLLFGNPQRSFYANEIVRHADAGIGTVQRELARLSAAGLLTVSRVGNQKHYQANREAPIFEELEAIVVKTMGPLSLQPVAAGIPRALHETRAQYNARSRGAPHAVPQRQLAEFCRRHLIKRLGIFGSAARGEASDASDVDLLVEFKREAPASLFDMVRMQEELSKMFGRKVDLATTTVLENPYRRRAILKDLRELYAA
jgi:predicted nucleotidyltransferase